MSRLDGPTLSKMSDAEYKLLAPEQLVAVNAELPKPNYENPYNPLEHPFPKMKYRLVKRGDGTSALQKATVANASEERKLGKDWHNNPTDCGVETCPGAPDVPVEEFLAVLQDEPTTEAADAPTGA